MPADCTTATLLKAVHFATSQHRGLSKKGMPDVPFVLHPLEVAETLADIGRISDSTTLIAAILHDTIEHAGTEELQIRELFGDVVLNIVLEVTDDKNLTSVERRKAQLANIPSLSPSARLIRLTDKICNLGDRSQFPPSEWTEADLSVYRRWSRAVADRLRGTNAALDARYDQLFRQTAPDEIGNG